MLLPSKKVRRRVRCALGTFCAASGMTADTLLVVVGAGGCFSWGQNIYEQNGRPRKQETSQEEPRVRGFSSAVQCSAVQWQGTIRLPTCVVHDT